METREFKDDVKAVVDYLAKTGVEVAHTVMLEAISHGFGERSWAAHRIALAALGQERGQPLTAPGVQPVASGQSQTASRAAIQTELDDPRCPCCGSDELEAAREQTVWVCTNCAHSWSTPWFPKGEEVEQPGSEEQACAEKVGVFVEAEFVSVWDGGCELSSGARLNLDTGLVDEIEQLDDEEVTTVDREFLRVTEIPELQFALNLQGDGYYVRPGTLKRIRQLLSADRAGNK